MAAAYVQNNISTDNFVGGETVSELFVGWTAGVGAEVMVTENLSIFTEYLYADLGTQTYSYGAPLTVGPMDLSVQTHTIKAGLNYRF